MSEHVGAGIADGGDHAARHRGGVHAQLGVHGDDHHVQLVEQLRLLVERTVVEDVALDAREQPEGRPAFVEVRHHRQLLAQPLRRQAARDGQPGRVVGEHGPLVAEPLGRAAHLLDRAAAVGPVGVQVAVTAKERPQPGASLDERGVRLALEPLQVPRHVTSEGLADHTGGLGSDALERLQGPVGDAPPGFADGQLADHRGSGAKGLHAVGRGTAALQQKGDPLQRLHGIHQHLRPSGPATAYVCFQRHPQSAAGHVRGRIAGSAGPDPAPRGTPTPRVRRRARPGRPRSAP